MCCDKTDCRECCIILFDIESDAVASLWADLGRILGAPCFLYADCDVAHQDIKGFNYVGSHVSPKPGLELAGMSINQSCKSLAEMLLGYHCMHFGLLLVRMWTLCLHCAQTHQSSIKSLLSRCL